MSRSSRFAEEDDTVGAATDGVSVGAAAEGESVGASEWLQPAAVSITRHHAQGVSLRQDFISELLSELNNNTEKKRDGSRRSRPGAKATPRDNAPVARLVGEQ